MENNIIESQKLIKDIAHCKCCPYYITEKYKHIVFGRGDITSKTVILLKRYADNLSQYYYRLLEDLYRKEFGRELTEDYYISYLPKCHNYSINKFAETEQLVNCCRKILMIELIHYGKYFKNIIIFDDILINILQNNSYPFIGKNIIYSNTPNNTDKFINEFKTIIANDRNLGI